MALPRSNRTTKPARSTCRCPLCAGTTIDADGLYHCRAGETVEYLVFVAGDFCSAYASVLAAETQLNAARRDALTAPVELAAAEADLDAQAAEFVAEQDVCGTCGEPASHPIHRDDSDDGHAYLPGWDEIHREWATDIANGEAEEYVTEETSSDCRSEHGITVGLIDSIIFVARILATRTMEAPEIQAALADLRDDADVRMLLAPPAEPLPFTPDNSPLDPRPTPPAISYNAATGLFSWVGAPRSYPTFLAADVARTAWLKRRRIAAAYPRTVPEVRAELVSRGLLLAA